MNIQTDEQLNQEQKGEAENLLPENVSAEDLAVLQEMMRAGLMYGHKKSKTNPKFRQYIFTTRNGIEILDLTNTMHALDQAVAFLKEKIKEKATVLVIATQPGARDAVLKFAKEFGFSSITERWIGGLLTNFKVISKRIEYYKNLQADLTAGRLDKYTKKERVMMNRDTLRMKKMFTGLENMEKVPDVLLVIDGSIKNHKTALHEAHRLKIKTIGVMDSDDDPDSVDYVIPANDHAKMSIEWIIDKITNTLKLDRSPESNSN